MEQFVLIGEEVAVVERRRERTEPPEERQVAERLEEAKVRAIAESGGVQRRGEVREKERVARGAAACAETVEFGVREACMSAGE